jgi:N-acyl-D-amino-acid deacylase
MPKGSDSGRTLLKNGFVVNGTGKPGFYGCVVVDKGKIEGVKKGIWEDSEEGFQNIVDCADLVIAPGFVDMHSHLDWYMAADKDQRFKTPFVRQGITTFVAGNCGYSAAGIKKDTAHIKFLENNLFKSGFDRITWNSFEEYFHRVEETGLNYNMALLAGHGTARTSVCGYDPNPSAEQAAEIRALLDEAMRQGAAGVSFGLQYEPGQYCRKEEIAAVAKLVRERKKLLTAHARAYSNVSGDYPMVPFGRAHNLKALDEFLEVARGTGVRLQLSHLIFVGNGTHRTCDTALKLIDKARAEGMDVCFDTYGHHCGVSLINVFLPPWVKAKVPGIFSDKKEVMKLKLLMGVSFGLIGFGYADIQILDMRVPELEEYNGMFLPEIARKRGMSDFHNYIDLVARTNSSAVVLMHNYTSPENLDMLIRHKASMFMTDAWMEPGEWQNPAVFGSLPRLLQRIREKKLLPLEEAIYKASYAPARRVGMEERGALLPGYAADITVLDWEHVGFDCDGACRDGQPSGIRHVFVNGNPLVRDGHLLEAKNAGSVIKIN